MLSVVVMAGCADNMPDGTRLQRFTEMIRGYDSTLTKSEKEAAISELQEEKKRQKKQLGQTEDTPKAN